MLMLKKEWCCSVALEGPYQPKLDIGKVISIFSYVPTPTKLTNAISKTQLSGEKKGGSRQNPPQMCPLFRFWRVLAVFSSFKPAE